MIEKVLFAWSGGKDSALALYELLQNPVYEVTALLTTLSESYDRVSMHGVRRVLLEQQAESLDVPVEKVFLPMPASNDVYEARMREVLAKYQGQGVSAVAFGDIFLNDLRVYREQNLKKIGLGALFPIWKQDTALLARRFITLGFKALVTCVDSQVLDQSFVGRIFDEQFLAELPPTVDPGGENGEFHSFVFDGPIFRNRVLFNPGEVVRRDDRFWFHDLLPVENHDMVFS